MKVSKRSKKEENIDILDRLFNEFSERAEELGFEVELIIKSNK